MEQRAFKNVNNGLNTNFYCYLSGAQISNLPEPTRVKHLSGPPL